VTISRRSCFLFLRATFAPIAILLVGFMYRHEKQVAQEKGQFFLPYHPGPWFTAMALMGVAIFVGALISISSDFWRTRRES
jgi:hypothetical protein